MARALLFTLTLFLSTLIGGTVIMVVGYFKAYSRFNYFTVLRNWARLNLWVAGTTVVVSGQDNVDERRPYIVVSNHQSHVDALVLIKHLPIRVCFIAKKELFRIPVFSGAMRGVGCLEIDRNNRARAIATLQQAAVVLTRENVSILAFPEGTRSPGGELLPFKRGPFMLALNTGFPILPVTIDGTYPILPKGRMAVRPGRVRLTIHPPVSVSDYDHDQRHQLVAHIHQTIQEGIHASERQLQ